MSAASHQTANATTQAGFPPAPSATHQGAGDVNAALEAGRAQGLGGTRYEFLPLFAKVAIERLTADVGLRHGDQLDELLQRYAEMYGLSVDLQTCMAAHAICARRFFDFVATARVAVAPVRSAYF